MKLNLGSFQIDLSSPKTAFFMVAILFFLMIISAYCGQTEKKFIRTNSGRLTTKQPTQKIRAKKKAIGTQTSSLLAKKIQKKLLKNSKQLKKRGDKTLKAKKGSLTMTEDYNSGDYEYSDYSDY